MRSKMPGLRTRPRELALAPLLLVRITLKSWEAVVVSQLIERLGHGTPAHSVSSDKRLPIDIDEHDGLMPRRAIHPDRRCLRSRARIDALPQAARRPAMTPPRPHLALAFLEAIIRAAITEIEPVDLFGWDS